MASRTARPGLRVGLEEALRITSGCARSCAPGMWHRGDARRRQLQVREFLRVLRSRDHSSVPSAWCRSHREGVQAVLVFWALWSNEHLGRPSFHLAKRSWKVWSCYGFDNKAFQLRNRPWPGSGGVILLPGQVWAWEEREFRALEPVPSAGVGGGSARRGWGSDARLTEYLEVARLGTSLHKAQRGAADTRERGSLSLFDSPLNSQIAAGH